MIKKYKYLKNKKRKCRGSSPISLAAASTPFFQLLARSLRHAVDPNEVRFVPQTPLLRARERAVERFGDREEGELFEDEAELGVYEGEEGAEREGYEGEGEAEADLKASQSGMERALIRARYFLVPEPPNPPSAAGGSEAPRAVGGWDAMRAYFSSGANPAP